MENSKRVILFLIILMSISCNKSLKKCQDCETTKDSLVFYDNNNVYIRIKAIYMHPKLEKELKANNYYEYYNRVFIYGLGKDVCLKEIIDRESFKKISDNYFEDINFVYSTPHIPKGDCFNLIDRKENIKLSRNKDTLYSKFGTFYRGDIIENNK